MDIQNLAIYLGAAGVVLVVLFIAILIARSMSGGIRGRRGQRLGISEYHDLDKSRRLVLVRRDGVEHLLLIGSHRDLVVEAGIPAAGLGLATGDDAPFLRRGPRMEPPPEPERAADPRPQPARMAPRPAVFGDRAGNLRALDPEHPRLVPVRDRYEEGGDGR
ncbi:MAG: flagellar biosynthetic protein FliO [Pseudomonadota bacterium]|nr:flagellar biosynthetic protein FliO [Pseudomonadota bacterium]